MPTYAAEYKLILNNPLGSGADQVARKISQLVREQSDIDLVVINQGAAGGLLAARDFKNERLAVMIVNTSQLIYGPLSGTNDITKSYSIEDFNIIANFGLGSNIWYTYPGSGINTIEDLVKVLPNLSTSAIGVATLDGRANANALVQTKKLSTVPVILFKNHNEVAISVAGHHTTVGICIVGTDTVWALIHRGDLKLIGHSANTEFDYQNNTLRPIGKVLKIPTFYGGSWLAITPGDTQEHRVLRAVILKAMQDSELQKLIRQTWPINSKVPFSELYNHSLKYKDMLK
jgi:tripartite-type tricarboxylate transporter receptor subunit TctC